MDCGQLYIQIGVIKSIGVQITAHVTCHMSYICHTVSLNFIDTYVGPILDMLDMLASCY